jgi:septal ring factor EnvC (AmiA/AmiB activator)
MFGSIKSIGIIITGVLVAAVISAATAYVLSNEKTKNGQANRIAVLESNEKQYLNAIDTQKDAIQFLENSVIRQRLEFERAEVENRRIRDQNREIRERIKSMELSKNAVENPSAVEIIINKNTADMTRCFELSTGSLLNENERNAKNAEEFNSSCPWLFDELRAP